MSKMKQKQILRAQETSSPLLIALSGPKGCGKTTVANMANATEIVSFAKSLKTIAKQVFGLTEDQVNGKLKEVPFESPMVITEMQARRIIRYMSDEILNIKKLGAKVNFSPHSIAVNLIYRGPFTSPRNLMQKLGTEIMQYIYKPFSPLVALYPHKDSPGVYIIDDMRFPLEDALARDLFKLYYPVRIVGRNDDVKDGHASEHAWKSIDFFAELDNGGSMGDLKDKAAELFLKIQADIKARQQKERKS